MRTVSEVLTDIVCWSSSDCLLQRMQKPKVYFPVSRAPFWQSDVREDLLTLTTFPCPSPTAVREHRCDVQSCSVHPVIMK